LRRQDIVLHPVGSIIATQDFEFTLRNIIHHNFIFRSHDTATFLVSRQPGGNQRPTVSKEGIVDIIFSADFLAEIFTENHIFGFLKADGLEAGEIYEEISDENHYDQSKSKKIGCFLGYFGA